MQEFFFMGGYGFFVWSCYAISALALLILFFVSYRSMRRSEIKLNELREDRIRTEGLIISSLTIVFPELKKELASVETVTTESPLKLSSIFN